jgi:hypothetical protein
MATQKTGLVTDKITLTTTAESYLDITKLPPPGKAGTYTVVISTFTVTGNGIKFNVGIPDTDTAAASNALWGAGTDDKLFLKITGGQDKVLMKASDNNDSFQYFVTADD